jgi:hypothetical protein
VTRSELSSDQLVVGYLEQFGRVGEWNGTIRIKWILNSSMSSQMTEDEFVLQVTREKNKTL